MKLVTYRRGPATNSSSSHSIILWPKNRPLPEEVPGDGEYGWDRFTLTSQEEKALYKHCQDVGGYYGQNYVDHQSMGLLNVPKEVREVFEKFYFSDRLVVLGGNDNGDQHHLYKPSNDLSETFNGRFRQEPWGWTFFNGVGSRYNSNHGVSHIRLSNDGVPIEEPLKSSVPDVLDHCGCNCEDCEALVKQARLQSPKDRRPRCFHQTSVVGIHSYSGARSSWPCSRAR